MMMNKSVIAVQCGHLESWDFEQEAWKPGWLSSLNKQR